MHRPPRPRSGLAPRCRHQSAAARQAADPAARERFLREACAAARLHHPNILPIYTVDEAGGCPFFTMPFATGGTLQDALDRGEAPAPERLRQIAAAVAAALGEAHASGIIHRDIKPANILFDAADPAKVWVCDFGIAQRTGAETAPQTPGAAVAGTPHYMSPEQARGEPLDGRSDLFSLGAVFPLRRRGDAVRGRLGGRGLG
ncbi:MAG: serine/threonine-protein kinase [Verrucomicrobiales bacterium]